MLRTSRFSRRQWLATVATAAAAAACDNPVDVLSQGSARLTARPRSASTVLAPGRYALDLGASRDGLLYVPSLLPPERPAPLIVMLHGGGSNATEINQLPELTDDLGVLLLLPESRGTTWDRVSGNFGPDIAFIDQAIDQTFSRCAVDPARIGMFGFSDGGSYALSVGLANGDLFTHVCAFAPGFLAFAERVGMPKVFVGHGLEDTIIPSSVSRDTTVPALRGLGYDVQYHEFAGGHSVNIAEREAALDWFLGTV